MNFGARVAAAFIGLCASSLAGSSQTDARVSAPKPLKAAWIKAQIEAHGATYVVQKLLNTSAYDEAMAHIDSGRADWIALAPKLAPGTDAGTSLMLTLSLAYGLIKNPAAVLSVLDPDENNISPQRVCGVLFIEPSDQEVVTYVRRAQSALKRVADPRLAERKSECLAALKQAAIRTPGKPLGPIEQPSPGTNLR
jgi:hypothetical protein